MALSSERLRSGLQRWFVLIPIIGSSIPWSGCTDSESMETVLAITGQYRKWKKIWTAKLEKKIYRS